ncbi:hypothetical protein CDAR_621361 [Caerostris darwini]|uniref:Uncharacterized protein n=1 Tax=Caerostris darwini TaxID=1538125 RepID=A0AAV4TRK1_9ARAC|nr:hypothetical protein CDAR_621361 [Caerostris darwini]
MDQTCRYYQGLKFRYEPPGRRCSLGKVVLLPLLSPPEPLQKPQKYCISRGGLFIETTNADDIDKIVDEINKSEGIKEDFKVTKPHFRNPTIICYNISSDTSEEEIISNIKRELCR